MFTTRHHLQILICTVLLTMVSATIAAEKAPPNAADLYRKAFKLHQPELNEVEAVYELICGRIEVNELIEGYVEANRKVIDIALEASKIKYCDWGFKYIEEDFGDPNESAEELKRQTDDQIAIRRIAYLILEDAKVHAHNSEIKKAVGKVFDSYSVSRHIFSDSITGYLLAISMEARVDNVLTDIISEYPLDVTMLNYIKRHLNYHVDSRHSLTKTFDYETQYGLGVISNVTQDILREEFSLMTKMMFDDPNVIEEINNCENIKYSEVDQVYFLKHQPELRKIFNMPYKKAIALSRGLDKKLSSDTVKFDQTKQNISVNSGAFMMQFVASPSNWELYYTLDTRKKTRLNALLTAIEIYKIKAKTGKLPDKIPANSPKDLFSDEDFTYKKTADGFILRSKGKYPARDTNYEWEFKTTK